METSYGSSSPLWYRTGDETLRLGTVPRTAADVDGSSARSSHLHHSQLHLLQHRNRMSSLDRCVTALVILFTAVVCLAVGVIIGWFTKPSTTAADSGGVLTRQADPAIRQMMFDKINTTNIRRLLRNYTAYSHLAGTEGDERLAKSVEEEWMRQGLHVTRNTYDVLLSYPNFTDPSYVQLLDGNRTVLHQSAPTEDILLPEQNVSDVIPPFNAYSPPGDISGELVYVNYATVEDFEYLKTNHSINFTNKIVIAKFGDIYRGDKVKLAAQYGASGIILYMDPADYAQDPDHKVFPNNWWLPGSGTQRGTTLEGDSDPLTPNYPSTGTAYRIPETNNPLLPKIPVHPIGYNDAYYFLKDMAGPAVPDNWQGGLNFTYHIGPGHVDSSWKTRLRVTTYNKRVNISDVIGFVNGTVEPDRYVLLGNHRDAWVFGGVDPTSATALMVELSRVTMELVAGGWKPRRSIVFCSWSAEEYGLMGSFEWVEDFVKLLGSRAVAYLNVDYIMEGNVSMIAGALPTMYDVIFEAAKTVKSPHTAARSVYDDWLETFPGTGSNGQPSGIPRVDSLGDASDFGGFVLSAGIPCYDAYYTHNLPVSGYPLYHTIYEGFLLYDSILDPQYTIARAVGQFWGETMRLLADVLILPLNVSTYANILMDYATELDNGYGSLMRGQGISLDILRKSIEKFQMAANRFHSRVSEVDMNNAIAIRMYNDQLMLVDRAFIDPQGLPLRPTFKHIIYAPSIFNAYAGATFPGLTDLMYQIDKQPNATEQWERVKQHYATIVYCIDSATAILRSVTTFNVQ